LLAKPDPVERTGQKYPLPYRDLPSRKRYRRGRAIGICAEIQEPAPSFGEIQDARIVSSFASHCQEKTGLEQEAKAGLLVGSLVCSVGLLHDLLHVVVMMNVVMAVVVAMMMMTMMLCHRGRICARRADNRHRESKCNRKPEGREEGLLHGSFPFPGRLT
jgi:hypothetical protein